MKYSFQLSAEQLSTLRYVLFNSSMEYKRQHSAFKALQAVGEIPDEEPAVGQWLEQLLRDIEDLETVFGKEGLPNDTPR